MGKLSPKEFTFGIIWSAGMLNLTSVLKLILGSKKKFTSSTGCAKEVKLAEKSFNGFAKEGEITLEITIPVYNEERTLAVQVEKLFNFLSKEKYPMVINILVADNGSTDKTPDIIEKLKIQYPNLKSLRLDTPGVGRALIHSWRNSNADYLGYMDLDFSTSLNHLSEVIALFIDKQANMIAGSRWLGLSKVENRSFKRTISSFVFNLIMQLKFDDSLIDSMCGFKFVSKNLFKKIDQHFELNSGWFFSAELGIFSKMLGARVIELPVNWHDDKESKVKVASLTLKYLNDMQNLEKKILTYNKYKKKHINSNNEGIEEASDKKRNPRLKKIDSFEELPFLILGTANWGSKVDKETAYQILSLYYSRGGRVVDTSINYPIDKNSKNFGTALRWLVEFSTIFTEIQVYVKICSATNNGDERSILNASYIEVMQNFLKKSLKDSYLGIGVHWDNRGEIDEEDVLQRNLISRLELICNKNEILGLSGVKNLNNYSSLPNNLLFQIKYNGKENEDFAKIKAIYGDRARVYVYGVAKSIFTRNKTTTSISNEIVITMKEIHKQGYSGIIFGTSTVNQTKNWMDAEEEFIIVSKGNM